MGDGGGRSRTTSWTPARPTFSTRAAFPPIPSHGARSPNRVPPRFHCSDAARSTAARSSARFKGTGPVEQPFRQPSSWSSLVTVAVWLRGTQGPDLGSPIDAKLRRAEGWRSSPGLRRPGTRARWPRWRRLWLHPRGNRQDP